MVPSCCPGSIAPVEPKTKRATREIENIPPEIAAQIDFIRWAQFVINLCIYVIKIIGGYDLPIGVIFLCSIEEVGKNIHVSPSGRNDKRTFAFHDRPLERKPRINQAYSAFSGKFFV